MLSLNRLNVNNAFKWHMKTVNEHNKEIPRRGHRNVEGSIATNVGKITLDIDIDRTAIEY